MKAEGAGEEEEGPRPASDTKNEDELLYAIPSLDTRFRLKQVSAVGTSTGTTLWLSSQVLVCYLIETERKQRRRRGAAAAAAAVATATAAAGAANTRRPLAVDLGAGVGLTSLVLAALGFDVITTDIDPPYSSVLLPNIAANSPPPSRSGGATRCGGQIITLLVDWTVASDVDALLAEADARGGADLVVTADTLYSPSIVDSLLACLAQLKRRGTQRQQQLDVQQEEEDEEEQKQRRKLEVKAKAKAGRGNKGTAKDRRTMILVALERRDPSLIEMSLARARSSEHRLEPDRVPQRVLNKAVDDHLGSCHWSRDDWDDVEVWHM
ncbi:hypothetical protein FA10DRAFT_265263 [Acaromyces ingoldii]|uniref:Uncharacterized protein n=1 Tax=Acaromyces ingoldii TaxID=215250 RepID=A0A316YPU8_9BASI|nr:hypothetical protein FA10DRAFT_265263 [Acaromyces ingoldii]PWN91407.1 hypothetical protein FA10DRAFT_265263 [Acaromyces ingoldii]